MGTVLWVGGSQAEWAVILSVRELCPQRETAGQAKGGGLCPTGPLVCARAWDLDAPWERFESVRPLLPLCHSWVEE